MEPGIQGSVILAGEYYPFLMYAGDNTPGLYIRTPLGSHPVKAGDGDHVPRRSIGRCDVSLVDKVPGRNLTLCRLGVEIGPRCRALSWHLRSPERHRLRELLS